ncbi:MAG TPA: class I SAM-dependent methyltransferase [Xanthobacteraceae bacterium]|nr:class I SAM-dependent methyltransferase [Xanthobacteraceae bacterium]
MRASAVTLESEVSRNELTALVSLLKTRRLTGPHLEIGTAAGGTLKELMRAYPEGARPHFVVVDPMTYFPDQFATVRRNLAEAGLDPATVDFRRGKSWPQFQEAEGAKERFAFIFVDGSHKIHHVTEDLAWTRLLEPGGIICFHDYSPRFEGVTGAVDRFLMRYDNYRVVEQVETLLIVEKTAPSAAREIGTGERLRAKLINILHQFRASREKRRARLNAA